MIIKEEPEGPVSLPRQGMYKGFRRWEMREPLGDESLVGEGESCSLSPRFTHR